MTPKMLYWLWAAIVALILLLFICAVEANAEGQKEPTYPPYCWVSPPGSDLWYPCNSEEAKDKECLNLMELAMKSVDPYLGTDRPTALDKDTSERLLKFWNRTKNTCWSELKDLQPQHYH